MAARLRIHHDWPVDPPDRRPGTGSAGRPGSGVPRAAPPDGRPAVVARANGWPLELRVWASRPRGVSEAIRHPSGVWVALRAL